MNCFWRKSDENMTSGSPEFRRKFPGSLKMRAHGKKTEDTKPAFDGVSSRARNQFQNANHEEHEDCGTGACRPEELARILVIDDDPIICDVIRDILEPGYEIDIALDGQSATRRIQDGPLDLIIMDYHLSGLDGKQLYEWIETNRPSLKHNIVFSTGDLFDENIHRFIRSTGCPCLFKPFSNSNLRQMVSDTLETESTA